MIVSYQLTYPQCDKNPLGSPFRFSCYGKGAQRTSYGLEQHLFCKSGHIRITSSLLKEEFLRAGEIPLVSCGSDYHNVTGNLQIRSTNPPYGDGSRRRTLSKSFNAILRDNLLVFAKIFIVKV